MDEWIKEIVTSYMNKGYKLTCSERCAQLINGILLKGEEMLFELRQSYLQSLSPSRIIATNKRLIIIRPSFMGLYAGHNFFHSTEFSIVPYKNIMTIAVLKGILLSTINVRITGFMSASAELEYEGRIEGVRTKEAIMFTDMVEEILERREEIAAHQEERKFARAERKEPYALGELSLEEAKDASDRFVWLGLEPVEYVSRILNIEKGKIVRMDVGEIEKANSQQLAELRGAVFICYDGKMSDHVVKYLKDMENTESYSLRGGIGAIAQYYLSKFV